MERYDEAMTLLKTGTSPRQEALVKNYNESVKQYHKIVAQLKEATKQPNADKTPQTSDVKPQLEETPKPTTKKKAVSKKKT
jgi:hypothetical protein